MNSSLPKAVGTMEYGDSGMVYGVWRQGYGAWCMATAVWCMEYGDSSMVYGVWLQGYGVRRGGLFGSSQPHLSVEHPNKLFPGLDLQNCSSDTGFLVSGSMQ